MVFTTTLMRFVKPRFLLLALSIPAIGIGTAASQGLKPGDIPRVFQIVRDYMPKGQTLAAIAALEKEREALMKDPVEGSVFNDAYAILLTHVGDQDGALRLLFGEPLPDRDFADIPSHPLDRARREDAVPAIAREAKRRQIVMLNEWHHVPQHRAFGLEVARALRREGYRYLAVEELRAENAASLQSGGAPRANAGYSGEPLFADFLREAVRMGYKLVPYEVDVKELIAQKPEERDQFRDLGAARNIKARILDEDPKAKILVFCGGDHLLERPVAAGSSRTRLGLNLKTLTGIDPLTVEQMTRQYFQGRDAQIPFRYAERKGWVPRPTVFRTAPGALWVGGPFAGGADMQVFHPAPAQKHGRAAWLSMGGYRRPVSVDPSLRPREGRVLVQARRVGDPENAVPVDQFILRADSAVPSLMLPRGQYLLVVQDEQGNSRVIKQIRV
ncbi:MAG: hypothetical protein ACO1SV_24760 [Fimbriimonas sp.]